MRTTVPFEIPWSLRVLIGLAVTVGLVAVAYAFVDQPVAYFIRNQGLGRHRWLKWLTRPPEVFVVLSPVVLLAGLLRRWRGSWDRLERVAVASGISTLLAALAVGILKITFGRPGPDLVLAGCADGFNLFSLEPAYWALPSGHTACTLSVMTVAWVAFPRWWVCWWLIGGVVAVTLIGLNHHFVGDILAGGFVGWAIAGTVARFLALGKSCDLPNYLIP